MEDFTTMPPRTPQNDWTPNMDGFEFIPKPMPSPSRQAILLEIELDASTDADTIINHLQAILSLSKHYRDKNIFINKIHHSVFT